jgi:site-specific recombinase XerD
MKGCRPLTKGEFARVVQSLTGRFALRDQALVILGERTGFRVSELLSLHVRDVYRDGRMEDWISVPKRVSKRQTQGRTLPLHPQAQRALHAWLEAYGYGPGLVLFPSRKGINKPLTRVQAWQILQRAARAAGLSGRIGFHSLRKKFADEVHEVVGYDLNATRELLGHKWVSTTQLYVTNNPQRLQAAVLAR